MRAPSTDIPIAFDNVSFVAGGVTILDRVALTIGPGKPTAIIGPNGAGKSTLMRIAAGLVPPTSGRVTWGGRDSTDGRHLAVVFQRPVMLRRSAAANVAYALPRSEAERVDALLARVGLAGLGARPARKLSGGEQQRLALARALARDPTVLFLDEPTASLDPAATKAVEDIVGTTAASGVKVVMTTQNIGQARRLAGDVVFMLRGRVHEHAETETLFATPASPETRAFLAGDLVI